MSKKDYYFQKALRDAKYHSQCVEYSNNDVFNHETKWLIEGLKEVTSELNADTNLRRWQENIVSVVNDINKHDLLPKIELPYVNENYCEIETIEDLYLSGYLVCGDDEVCSPNEEVEKDDIESKFNEIEKAVDLWIDNLNVKFGTKF